jgi:hypothetical protein
LEITLAVFYHFIKSITLNPSRITAQKQEQAHSRWYSTALLDLGVWHVRVRRILHTEIKTILSNVRDFGMMSLRADLTPSLRARKKYG